MSYRNQQRFLMYLERVACDLCRTRPGSHMHEIVTRGRTVNNQEARLASYDKYICAWLCPECHEKAHSPAIAFLLLNRNIEHYGYDKVNEAYKAVAAAMKMTLDIPFPERTSCDP